MCGISALIGRDGRDVAGLLHAMTRLIRHRGPDDEGYALVRPGAGVRFFAGPDTPAACGPADLPFAPRGRVEEAEGTAPIALGHRRLSIIDLAPTGHQPMSTADGRHVIVFNGEIYNFVELRAELEAFGHAFITRSDTEVILCAYRQWGKACLSRFNGMFAFVLIDVSEGTAFLARDRFGVKPLYYWVSPEGFLAVASEIKQFSALPGWRPRVNGQRAYDFLVFSTADHTDETTFDGVHQLRGGECALLRADRLPAAGGALAAERWYALEPRPFAGDFAAAAARFGELFADAVRIRLRADVPVGTALSGGLDSSSVTCVASRILRAGSPDARLNTFSSCSHDRRYDEREHADVVVRDCGAAAHYVYPSDDELIARIDEVVWHHDEPFASTSVFAEWSVFGLVATTPVKVNLDGHGADELLAGYHAFFAPHLADLFRGMRWPTLLREARAIRARHGHGLATQGAWVADALLGDALRRPLRRALGRAGEAADWVDAGVLRAVPRDPARSLGLRGADVNRTSGLQFLSTSLPVQLRWCDRDSMAHSIESRAPFLDYRLVEFALGLPPSYKLEAGVTKRVLREAMTGVLPESIRNRVDKLGFVTPEAVWVRSNPDRYRSWVRAGVNASQGIFGDRTVAAAERIIDGRAPFDFLLWRIICFGAWMRRFGVSPAA